MDTVLEAAYNAFPGGITNIDINDALKRKGIEVTGGLTEEIIDHLIKKEYLKYYEQTVTLPAFKKDAPHWAITFDGRIFHLRNGYAGVLERDNSEKEKNLKIQKTQEDLQDTMKTYQKWIVVATGVAGIYYLKEVLIWGYHLLFDCHCHY